MVDVALFSTLDKNNVPFNERIADGFVSQELDNAPAYIDSYMRSTVSYFPSNLTYEGICEIEPDAEYFKAIDADGKRRRYEVSRFDIYMMGLKFTIDGKPYIHHVYLPYSEHSNIIVMKDSIYGVSPVLTDSGYSVNNDILHIPMFRVILQFRRSPQGIMENGERTMLYISHCTIYRNSKPDSSFTYRAKTVSSLYLLARFGFDEAVKLITDSEIIMVDGEVDRNLYPEDEWNVYSSTGDRPSNMNGNDYWSTDIRIVARKKDCSNLVKTFIMEVIYIIEYFSERVTVEERNETTLWCIILGYVVMGDDNEGALIERVENHLSSIEKYITADVIEDFRASGMRAETIYDVILFAMENIFDILKSTTRKNNLYSKRLMILRFLLTRITNGISAFGFALEKHQHRGVAINERLLNRLLNENISPRKVKYELTSVKQEIASVNVPSDNKIPKLTASVISHADATARKKSRPDMGDKSLRLDLSLPSVCSIYNLPKSNPTGFNSINPTIGLRADGTFKVHEDYAKLSREFAEELNRRT